VLTIDARCALKRCEGSNIYRMVGSCGNCHTQDILVLLTAGHKARGYFGFRCPVCGCDEVHVERLATEDEIPVDVPTRSTQGVT
jgi:hypothetical protein